MIISALLIAGRKSIGLKPSRAVLVMLSINSELGAASWAGFWLPLAKLAAATVLIMSSVSLEVKLGLLVSWRAEVYL